MELQWYACSGQYIREPPPSLLVFFGIESWHYRLTSAKAGTHSLWVPLVGPPEFIGGFNWHENVKLVPMMAPTVTNYEVDTLHHVK